MIFSILHNFTYHLDHFPRFDPVDSKPKPYKKITNVFIERRTCQTIKKKTLNKLLWPMWCVCIQSVLHLILFCLQKYDPKAIFINAVEQFFDFTFYFRKNTCVSKNFPLKCETAEKSVVVRICRLFYLIYWSSSKCFDFFFQAFGSICFEYQISKVFNFKNIQYPYLVWRIFKICKSVFLINFFNEYEIKINP